MSEHVSNFFELAVKENIYDLTMWMEAYILSGVHGKYIQCPQSLHLIMSFDRCCPKLHPGVKQHSFKNIILNPSKIK